MRVSDNHAATHRTRRFRETHCNYLPYRVKPLFHHELQHVTHFTISDRRLLTKPKPQPFLSEFANSLIGLW